MTSTQRWAESCFGDALLGDDRRTARLVEMARRAALAPAGRVTQVFRKPDERQAAYDFLEHDCVSAEPVGESLFRSTALKSRAHSRVLVAIDGTSLSLLDKDGLKGFGRIGAVVSQGRGLKLINALALTAEGTPIGVADQLWWSRDQVADQRVYRRPDQRESRYWRDAIARIVARYSRDAEATKLHFLADREADATHTISELMRSGHEFTIRSNGARKVAVNGRRCELRRVLGQQKPIARLKVELPANRTRETRLACLEIRAAVLPIVWRDRHSKKTRRIAPVGVVWAREISHRTSAIEWVLFTNASVRSAADACAAVRRYTMRWRIEDFHRTWKSGVCRVEDTQLRSTSAVIKWATILSAVASRIERLRRLCREQPDVPAATELTEGEIEALVWLKNEGSKRPVSAENISILQATRWIADLGGHVANKRTGLPGATTIGRGMERVLLAAQMLARLRAEGRLR